MQEHRRVLPILALTGLLTATACGGGTSSGFAPPAGDARASAVPSPRSANLGGGPTGPSGSPSPSHPASRALAFPPDFRVVYRADPAPPKAAEAVRALGEFWKAWWYAVATGDGDRRYRKYIAPGSVPMGTALFVGVVEDWKREGVRPVGVIRAYDIQVVAVDEEGVALVGCGDESRAGTKNVVTGKVSWSFGRQKNARYKMRIMMVPGPDGGWQISAYQPIPMTSPAGEECR